jgi:beta-glucosidase-like glycosyl hydrolase
VRSALTLLLVVGLAAGCATVARAPAELTLDEKIGQLFVYVARGGFKNEESAEWRALVHQVRDNHVGSIAWASGSTAMETAFFTRKLQEMSRVPLLVSADLEAGPGMRFLDTTSWPWPMALAAAGDPDLARREGQAVAEEARALGLNQIYAPVADVNDNPANPVINVRSFGEDPPDVARYVAAYVEGAQSRGVIATVKHFPGHGSAVTDSHRSLPVSDKNAEDLNRTDLIPFRAAIAAGVGAVMTGHLALPQIDPTPAPPRLGGELENPFTHDPADVTQAGTVPASLSPAITGLLRGELGFRGLVVTDALDMGGIVDHYAAAESAVRAILAGADQVLKSPDTDAAVAGVRQAVESGRISRARLDESVRRVLEAKSRVGDPAPDPDRIFRTVDEPKHRALSEEIARRSLTLLREENGALPLTPARRVLLVALTDSAPHPGDDLANALKPLLGAPPERMTVNNRSTPAEKQAVLDAAARADVILLALFVHLESGRGSIALPDSGVQLAHELLAASSPVAVLSFGSPYLVSEFPEMKTCILAWGGQPDAQVAVARALAGEALVTGRTPVTIPGIAARGEGIRRDATGGARSSGRP